MNQLPSWYKFPFDQYKPLEQRTKTEIMQINAELKWLKFNYNTVFAVNGINVTSISINDDCNYSHFETSKNKKSLLLS